MTEPTELPPALSEDERAWLSTSHKAGRALGWIDAATKVLGKFAVQVFLDGRRIKQLERELTAANALLGAWDAARDPRSRDQVRAATRAHLANQPAAPTRTDVEQLTPEAAWDVLTDYVDVPDRNQAVLFAALQERARRGVR